MKTKVLLAAVAVAFSFALTSCGNKKAADTVVAADSTAVEQVCDSAKACCKADSAACDKACGENCAKACGEKCDKTNCANADCKKACDKKEACDKKTDCKKACDKK